MSNKWKQTTESQEYLDLGLPQLDTPPSSQESSEAEDDDDAGEEKFPYLLWDSKFRRKEWKTKIRRNFVNFNEDKNVKNVPREFALAEQNSGLNFDRKCTNFRFFFCIIQEHEKLKNSFECIERIGRHRVETLKVTTDI